MNSYSDISFFDTLIRTQKIKPIGQVGDPDLIQTIQKTARSKLAPDIYI